MPERKKNRRIKTGALLLVMGWMAAAAAGLILVGPAWAEQESTEYPVNGGEKTQELPEPDGEEAVPTVAPPEKIILLKSGSKGEEVRILQARLRELGYLDAEPDGNYGSATRAAVQQFQRRNSLSVDGIAGKQTQGRLYSAEAIPAPEPPTPVDVLVGEWPMLTNLTHPVGDNFLPADLVLMTELCDADLVKIKYESTQGVRRAVEALVTMLEAAHAEGLTKWQVSAGYRSYAEQESLLNSRINTYLKKNEGWSRSRARRAALRTVAEPGASEHHLGLSFDVNVPGASNFSSTKQCTWLNEHCWEYGFIIRYQKGKEEITGISAEPWHIRYVGMEHSLTIRDEGLCLEEYLEKYHPEEGNPTEIVENVTLAED